MFIVNPDEPGPAFSRGYCEKVWGLLVLSSISGPGAWPPLSPQPASFTLLQQQVLFIQRPGLFLPKQAPLCSPAPLARPGSLCVLLPTPRCLPGLNPHPTVTLHLETTLHSLKPGLYDVLKHLIDNTTVTQEKTYFLPNCGQRLNSLSREGLISGGVST